MTGPVDKTFIRVTPGHVSDGIWCNDCLTSSRFEVAVYVWGELGPVQIGILKRCRRCEPGRT